MCLISFGKGRAGPSVTDHPNDSGAEVFFQLLGTITAVAIACVESTGAWVVAKNPEKRRPIANGSVMEALRDTGAPVRLTHVDRVQLEVDVDVRLRGNAGNREANYVSRIHGDDDWPPFVDPASP